MSNVQKFAALVRQHVGNPDIVFEFGARDCEESVAISREFPDARIYSFECNRATLPVCRARTEEHPMITLVESAVGDRDGIATFHPIDQQKTVTTWDDGNPGASSLFLASGKYEVESYVQRSEEVSIVRPDTFMAARGIQKVSALWMDIQGAELMALHGFGERISDVDLLSLEAEFIEIYEGQPLFWEIHDFLSARGFLLAGFLSFGRYSCDAVFVRDQGAGVFDRFRSFVLFWFARLGISLYFPLRKAVGTLLRKTGLRK
ncbi:MAG: FkbM family methyltransferase [Luteolibacter sp.]|uniref:FkbM family methyltransferase n=1 Tax=Luteolibacter sp. TaxID=1962973 RepID=UPI003264CF06